MKAIQYLDFTSVDLTAIDLPDQGERTIRDTDSPTLGLRLRASGSRTWVIFQVEAGKTKRTTLGDAFAIPIASARIMAGTSPSPSSTTASQGSPDALFSDSPTIADVMRRFLAAGSNRRWKPSTVRQMEFVSRSFIIPRLGHIEVRALSSPEVARWHREVTSQTTVERMALSTLSGLMLYAEDHELRPIGTNPCRGLRKKRTAHRGRPLPADALKRLWAALERLQPVMTTGCDAVRLLLLTGARRSEILGLTWDRIVGARAVLDDSKTGPRAIWLNTPARAILDRRKTETRSQFVFPSPSRDGHIRIIDQYWWAIRREAGLGGLRVHDLRHHFASVGVSNGVDLHVVGRLLGHHDIDSTLCYAHLATGALAKSASRVSGLIARSLEDPSKREKRKRREAPQATNHGPVARKEASNG